MMTMTTSNLTWKRIEPVVSSSDLALSLFIHLTSLMCPNPLCIGICRFVSHTKIHHRIADYPPINTKKWGITTNLK